MNGIRGADSAAGSTHTDCKGGRFGGYAYNDTNLSGFDLYCAVLFAGELSVGQADSISQVLTDFYSLSPLARNLILEGDSITAGGSEIPTGANTAMALTEPGLGLVASDVRVINMAIAGAMTSDAVNRRDTANGWPSIKLGDRQDDNILAFQMGRNDTSSGGLSPEQTYQAILSYWNANAVGVLARGWRPYQMANIACDAGETTIDLHDRIIGSFSADVAGGTVIDLQRIRDSGGGHGEDFAPFDFDAQNATYFQTVGGVLDTTHPSIYGTKIMASGGDTPQYGYAAIA